MTKTVIEANNITKVYSLYNNKADRLKEVFGKRKRHIDFYALRDITFSVKQGENVGFIGKNGSGKSTLLKILTGVLTPTSGTFRVEGKVSALLELGAGFNMEYTGIENIYLNGSLSGFSRAEMDEKMDDICAFADIGEFIYQPVKMYSSGMFVRLAFAVAINVDPEVLIVDEALSVGDIFFQRKCYKKFEDFKNAGKTIIFVTHDLNSVIKYCDRSYLLNEGRIVDEGSPRHIVDMYKKLISGIDISESITESGQANAYESGAGEYKAIEIEDGVPWKSYYALNPDLLSYGDGEVEIVDFGIFDKNNKLVISCDKGETYAFRIKIKANQTVENPIIAFAVKDIKGLEITGNNTDNENINLGILKPGEEVTVDFTQRIDLQNAQFFLSLGCTKYLEDGSLKVFHRLYDIIELNILSAHRSFGFFDMNSKISVNK